MLWWFSTQQMKQNWQGRRNFVVWRFILTIMEVRNIDAASAKLIGGWIFPEASQIT